MFSVPLHFMRHTLCLRLTNKSKITAFQAHFLVENPKLVEKIMQKMETIFVTRICEIFDIENLYIPATAAFQAYLHVEKHDYVEKRM